jgi:hypothetical protein
MRKLLPALLLALFIAGICLAPAIADDRVFLVGDKVKVMWRDRWEICTILELKEGKYKVHFEENEKIFDKWVSAKIVFNYNYRTGEVIQVEREGRWLPAKVLASGGNKYKVHFLGLESNFDEWVGPDRIQDISYRIGERIQVMWLNDWLDAVVIQYNNGQYLVHFEGFQQNQDQWVTVERMRKK